MSRSFRCLKCGVEFMAYNNPNDHDECELIVPSFCDECKEKFPAREMEK
jgi:hypothetical protein